MAEAADLKAAEKTAYKKGHWFASDYIRNMLQAVVVCVASMSVVLGIVGYKFQSYAKRVDATFEYTKRLQDDVYTRALWDLNEFTKCYEKAAGQWISYLRYDQVTSEKNWPITEKLVRGWWDYVENDDSLSFCSRTVEARKPNQLEEDIVIVYGRLEALASCGAMGLCELDLVVPELTRAQCGKRVVRELIYSRRPLWSRTDTADTLLESFDWQTVLGISNYLLLADDGSREWGGQDGNIITLIKRFEKVIDCHGGLTEKKLAALREIRRR